VAERRREQREREQRRERERRERDPRELGDRGSAPPRDRRDPRRIPRRDPPSPDYTAENRGKGRLATARRQAAPAVGALSASLGA
jgi:hypothetical protein